MQRARRCALPRTGNIALVMEALKERGLLRQNAPHLVSNLAFVVPNYDWWEAPFYGLGRKIENVFAGKYGFGSSEILTREETLAATAHNQTDGLRGGVVYYGNRCRTGRDAAQLPYSGAEVVWAARHEMARTVARRSRALFLNAHAAEAMAPELARLMAGELGWDAARPDAGTAMADNHQPAAEAINTSNASLESRRPRSAPSATRTAISRCLLRGPRELQVHDVRDGDEKDEQRHSLDYRQPSNPSRVSSWFL